MSKPYAKCPSCRENIYTVTDMCGNICRKCLDLAHKDLWKKEKRKKRKL